MHPHLNQSRFGGARVLFVMAVEAEYGACLRALCKPLMTGVGVVEAAVGITRALALLEAAGTLPDLVVSLGSAGSATLHQTHVYQAINVSYRDMDASALGFPKGETPFLGLPRELPLPTRIPGVAQASLSSGSNVVSGAGYDTIDADMVDMETYAILRACQSFGVPLIALRGISDGDKELAEYADWTQYLHCVDRNLAQACELLAQGLTNGDIKLGV